MGTRLVQLEKERKHTLVQTREAVEHRMDWTTGENLHPFKPKCAFSVCFSGQHTCTVETQRTDGRVQDKRQRLLEVFNRLC